MDGVSGVPQAVSSVQFQAQVEVAAAKKQVEAVRDEGEATLKLIQSANVDPAVGRRLNVAV